MRVRVQYTAQLRAAVGVVEDDVDMPDDGTVADLVVLLATDVHPEAAPFVLTTDGDPQPSLLIGVNGMGVAPGDARHTMLRAGDVVALMPPIAGG